jgi:surfactin synthase thioesterase subunit
MGAAKALPLGQQRWTSEQLLSALEGMAYQVSEAKEMVARAMPYLRADQTLEEALRVILQNEGKGGQ